jgi:hypothetical protein
MVVAWNSSDVHVDLAMVRDDVYSTAAFDDIDAQSQAAEQGMGFSGQPSCAADDGLPFAFEESRFRHSAASNCLRCVSTWCP